MWTSTTGSGRRARSTCPRRPCQRPQVLHRLRHDHATPATATHHLTLYRARQRRPGVRRGHGPVGLGPRQQQSDAGIRRRPEHAAGDRQPVRRHGRAADHADAGLVAATASTDTDPADVDHHLARSAAPPSPTAHQLTVTGTATDTGGGWSPASRSRPTAARPGTRRHRGDTTTSWTYTWTPAAATDNDHQSRAVDDSGNLETPVRRTSVNVTCPCSLFGADDRRPPPIPATRTRRGRVSSSPPTPSARSPASASTRPAPTPAPTSAACGPRAASCSPPRPSPARRPRAGSRSPSPTRCRSPEHHLRRLVLRPQRPLLRDTTTSTRRLSRRATALSTARPCTRSASTTERQRRLQPTGSASTFPTGTYDADNYWVDPSSPRGGSRAGDSVTRHRRLRLGRGQLGGPLHGGRSPPTPSPRTSARGSDDHDGDRLHRRRPARRSPD